MNMIVIDSETGLAYITPLVTTKIDIVGVLSHVIDTQFHQSNTLFQQDLQSINDLRLESLSDQNVSLETITKLKKYHTVLKSLMDVFPDGTSEFTWNEITSGSWNFELEHVEFQLASYYTLLAVQESKVDDEGMKKAGVYYQYAAGYIDQLPESTTTKSMKELMYAQSQEIYLNKADMDAMQDSVLLKLAIQISEFYQTAYEYDPGEFYILKDYYYKCYAYELYSKLCHDKSKYGDELSYLYECMRLFSQLESIKNDVYAIVLQDIENLKLKIGNKLESLKQENEMLHLQHLPDFNKYKPLPRVKLVKSLVPNESEYTLVSKPLAGLIPLNMVEEILECQDQFSDFVDCELIVPLDKLNAQLETLKSEYNIDVEIKKLLSKAQLPMQILANRTELLEFGNLDKLSESLHLTEDLKRQCRTKLDHAWKLLKEQVDDESSSAEYYGYKRWSLGFIENDKVGGMLTNTFKIYESYMKQSADGDKMIHTQIEELTPFLKIYDDLKVLEDYIPDSDVLSLNPNMKPIINNLQEIALVIDKLQKERNLFLNKVDQKTANVNLIEIYRKTPNTDPSTILANEIMKFNKEVEFITSARHTQDELISKFNKSIQDFNHSKDRLKVSNNRREAIHVLESTHNGFFEIIGNLNQGKDFYQNLMDNIDVKTVQLEQFLAKRSDSKHELQRKLEMEY